MLNEHEHDNEQALTTGLPATTIYIPVPGTPGPAGEQGLQGVSIPGPQGPAGVAPAAGVPARNEWIYKLTTTNVAPEAPTVNFLGEGWSTVMLGTDELNQYQWVCVRYVGGGLPEDWSVPTLYSNYALPGMDGVDGSVIEFIFRLSPTQVIPITPTDPVGTDDYIPALWLDNASGPTPLYPFEYFSKRVKVNGFWMPYDTPALWAKYSANGEDGVDGKDIEFVFKRTNVNLVPATPVGDPNVNESYPLDWSDDPISVTSVLRWQWFAKRTKVNGVWSVYSEPALWSLFALDGQDGKDGKDMEWIFKQSAVMVVPNTPVAPDNLTDDWVDVANGWSDNAQGVTELLPYEYTTNRRRLDNGTWAAFSTPALWAKWGFDGVNGIDGDTFEFVFKRTAGEIRPAIVAGAVQSNDYVPTGWTDNALDITPAMPFQWQATRKKVDGIWGEFSLPALVHRIGAPGANGAAGRYTELRYAKNGSNIAAPDLANTADFPGGWISAPLSLLYNEYLWMTTADKNADGTLIGSWSEPIRVNGINGSDGQDGKGVEFIFQLGATSATPATPATNQIDDSVPAGWTDNQSGVTPGYPFEFVSNRKKANGVWTGYSQPVVWAKYSADGEDGVDGIGTEFIFRRAASSVPPATPPTSQVDAYLPTNWSDNPTGITSSYPYEFISKRTKTNGVWSEFSAPKIWSQMGEKGDTVAGPAITYRGEYSPVKVYNGNLTLIEIVKYNDGTGVKYYMTRTDAGAIPAGTLPSAVAKWNPFVGQFENIATGLLFAERAVVDNLVVTDIDADKGTIANFTITANKLEGGDSAVGGGTRITLDATPGNPFIEIVGFKSTRIDAAGFATNFGNLFQANVGRQYPIAGSPAGDGGFFIDCDNVFYRHGNDATTGNPWYGGRLGDYGTTGYAFIQRSPTWNGPKLAVGELFAQELYSSTGTVMTSDENLKRNIVPLPYGLSDVMRLNSVRFQYDFSKSKNPMYNGIINDKVHLGLLAQAVEQIIPELVTIDQNGEYGMNMTEVIPVLINAIKELKELVDTKQDK